MKEYNCYLFDLDGTVVNSVGVVLACFRHVLTNLAGVIKTDEEVAAEFGQPLRQMYAAITANDPYPPDAALIESWVQAHLEYQSAHCIELVKLYDGSMETLQALKRMGKKIALVTSRARGPAEMFLQNLGIMEFFDAVLTPEDTAPQHKPHPEPALKALEILGGCPEEALFIGDAKADIQCGQTAGMHTCYVAYADGLGLGVLEAGPTYRISNLLELLLP